MSDRAIDKSAPYVHVDRLWINEPLLVVAGCLLLAALAHGGTSAARVVLGTVLALFGTGWSLVAVLFARRLALDVVERLALAGVLSLALGGLLGFFLARSSWGLQLAPLLTLFAVFNLACCVAVWLQTRRAAQPPTLPLSWLSPSIASWWRAQSSSSRVLTLVLVLLAGSGLWSLGRALAAPVSHPPMTEFYLLDEHGNVDNFPQAAIRGDRLTLRLGISNRERVAETYQVYAVIENKQVGVSQMVHLTPGQSQEVQMDLQMPTSATGPTKIEMILLSHDTIRRRLHLWIDLVDGEWHANN